MQFNLRIFALIAVASLISLAAGLAVVRAADAPKSSAADDEQALQGSWIVQSAEFQAMPSEDPVGHTFTFAAGKVTLQRKDKDRPAQFACTLNQSKTPKEIELTPLDDSGKADPSKIVRGIYRVEGNVLRICMNDRPGPEPTPAEFTTDKNSTAVLLVLKRQK